MTRSLRTIEAILSLTLDEAKLALPELRHSLQQIDDMVTGVNDKFTAADRAMNATGAAITGWRDRVRETLGSIGRRRHANPDQPEES
jgi:predicted  nucleic acid-binding Zn-ribbon protein